MNNEVMIEDIGINKQKLEQQYQKAEDYRYIPRLVWMEMYLPRFEKRYGKFNYSNESISNKQKCQELLDYFGNICGVNKVEEIYKRGRRR